MRPNPSQGASNERTGASSIKFFVEGLAGTKEITSETAEAATKKIRNYIIHHMQGVSPHEVDDILSEVLEKLVRLAREDKIPSYTSDAYFLIIARRVAIDRFRRPQFDVNWSGDSELLTLADEGVAANFDAIATAESIRWALGKALEANDTTACQVVTVALNETQQFGEVPSHRAIASQLGISHTAVAKALSRFRAILMEGERD